MWDLMFSAVIKLLLQQEVRGFIESPTWCSWSIKTFDAIKIETSFTRQEVGEAPSTDFEVMRLIWAIDGRFSSAKTICFDWFFFAVSF